MRLSIPYQAGELSRRMTIERRAGGTDGAGSPLADWQMVAAVWARVRPLTARELVAAQAVNAEITHEVLMRFRRDITASMRGVIGGEVYTFIAPPIDVDDKRVMLRLLCSTGLLQG